MSNIKRKRQDAAFRPQKDFRLFTKGLINTKTPIGYNYILGYCEMNKKDSDKRR